MEEMKAYLTSLQQGEEMRKEKALKHLERAFAQGRNPCTMRLIKNGEVVIVENLLSGEVRSVNVACDSISAMICDICQQGKELLV